MAAAAAAADMRALAGMSSVHPHDFRNRQEAMPNDATPIVPVSYDGRKLFSEVMWNNPEYARMVPSNPSTDGMPLYNEGKEIFWLSFADVAFKNVEVLRAAIVYYIQTPDSEIFTLFPLKNSPVAKWINNVIDITPVMPEIGTRNVPFRNVPMRVSSRARTAQFTGQGFMVDMNTIYTPEGMEFFNAMVAQLRSNIWMAVATAAGGEFKMEPMAQRLPKHLYPFGSVPTTPAGAIEFEAAMTFGLLNKEVQAIHRLIAYAQQVFSPDKERVGTILLTTEDANHINISGDDTQKWYNLSGPQAVENRSGNRIRNLHGINTIAMPLMDLTLHSPNHDYLMRDYITVGSKAHFCNPMHYADPAKFKSDSRTIKFPSWTTGKHDEHTFKDFLHHCMQFNPIPTAAEVDFNGREEGSEDDGKINRQLMMRLARNVEESFAMAGTTLRGNEDRVDPLMGFDAEMASNNKKNSEDVGLGNGSDPHCPWYPINAFGEISIKFVPTRYLMFTYKTMEKVIFAGCTEEDKKVFQRGIDLVEQLRKPPTLFHLQRVIHKDEVEPYQLDAKRWDVDGEETEPRVNVFTAVNRHGGLPLDIMYDLDPKAPVFVPYGYGTWSGLATLYDYIVENPTTHRIAPAIAEIVLQFVPLYKKVVTALYNVTAYHAALDPKSCPQFHRPNSLDNMTKLYIVSWYYLADAFNEPYSIVTRLGPHTSGDLMDPGKALAVINPTRGKFDEAPKIKLAADLGLLADPFILENKLILTAQQLATITKPEIVKGLVGLRKALGQRAFDYKNYPARAQVILEGLQFPNWLELTNALEEKLEDIQIFLKDHGLDHPIDTIFTFDGSLDVDADPSRIILLPINIKYDGKAYQYAQRPGPKRPARDAAGELLDNLNIEELPQVNDNVESGAYRLYESFYDQDRHLFSSTLITGMSHVNKRIPNIGRGRVGPNGEIRTTLYRNQGPFNNYQEDENARDEEQMLREMIHDESKFQELRQQFPDLHDFVIHNIIHPVSGYKSKKMTTFECRWLAANKLPAPLAFAAKAVLMQTICLKATDAMYDNDINIPFNGMIARPWEEQEMISIVTTATGEIGSTRFNGLDSTVGFDQGSQMLPIQAFMRFKTLLPNPRKWFILPFVRGGRGWGKGNQYINHTDLYGAVPEESPFWQNTVADRLFSGEKLGNNALIAVLQGYETAVKDTFTDRHYDIRGRWYEADFLGRLKDSEEFGIRSEPMFDGVFFMGMTHNINAKKKTVPMHDNFTFWDQAQSRATNFHIDQVTQYIKTVDGKWQRINDAHYWGAEDDGFMQREQSLAPVKMKPI
jgi:hypothetical protein